MRQSEVSKRCLWSRCVLKLSLVGARRQRRTYDEEETGYKETVRGSMVGRHPKGNRKSKNKGRASERGWDEKGQGRGGGDFTLARSHAVEGAAVD